MATANETRSPGTEPLGGVGTHWCSVPEAEAAWPPLRFFTCSTQRDGAASDRYSAISSRSISSAIRYLVEGHKGGGYRPLVLCVGLYAGSADGKQSAIRSHKSRGTSGQTLRLADRGRSDECRFPILSNFGKSTPTVEFAEGLGFQKRCFQNEQVSAPGPGTCRHLLRQGERDVIGSVPDRPQMWPPRPWRRRWQRGSGHRGSGYSATGPRPASSLAAAAWRYRRQALAWPGQPWSVPSSLQPLVRVLSSRFPAPRRMSEGQTRQGRRSRSAPSAIHAISPSARSSR
jgi:hypothetical protein